MSGHLWQIIQEHLDAYGVREAEFARRIGTSPQTVNSWKKRGVRSLPDKALLVGVSEVTRRPYDEVLTAVLFDISYLPKENDRGNTTATKRAPGSGATVHDLDQAAHDGTPTTERNRKVRAAQERTLGEESQDEGDA